MPMFIHRNNQDGSCDSICTECYSTVASVKNAWQLSNLESTHDCNDDGLMRQRTLLTVSGVWFETRESRLPPDNAES